MSKAEFVYVIYIEASREKVWEGLTAPEFTRQYWLHEWVSDWQVGSSVEHRRSDGTGTVDIAGKILESEPPGRLVITWARPDDAGDPAKISRVTFDIKEQEGWPGGPWSQVQIAHTELEAGSDMLESISWGWPAVLSGLKTVLECGGLGKQSA